MEGISDTEAGPAANIFEYRAAGKVSLLRHNFVGQTGFRAIRYKLWRHLQKSHDGGRAGGLCDPVPQQAWQNSSRLLGLTSLELGRPSPGTFLISRGLRLYLTLQTLITFGAAL